MWPDFNSRHLQLSLGARNQFAGIDEAVQRTVSPGRGKQLLAMLTEHAYAPDKGTYMPVSDRVKFKGKLTDVSKGVCGPRGYTVRPLSR